MVTSFPEIVRVKREMPEYYAEFEKALQHAETVYTSILSKPLYHTRYAYQEVRDIWQEVINRWEQIAIGSQSLFLQKHIASGSRILQKHVMERLETMRKYDTSPYRTVWFGTGQPKDPYDSNTVTFV